MLLVTTTMRMVYRVHSDTSYNRPSVSLSLVLEVGRDYGALGAIVSGSGPTVAFLVADEDSGLDLAVALTASGVVGSVARAHGPVHGAKVI